MRRSAASRFSFIAWIERKWLEFTTVGKTDPIDPFCNSCNSCNSFPYSPRYVQRAHGVS
jgi:hypothetical protein